MRSRPGGLEGKNMSFKVMRSPRVRSKGEAVRCSLLLLLLLAAPLPPLLLLSAP